METKYSTVNSKFSKEESALGFLGIGAGGSGKLALQSAIEQHQAAGNPFPFFTAAIDTDRRDFDSFVRWTSVHGDKATPNLTQGFPQAPRRARPLPSV